MRAILLAAGYATRLYPLTRDHPKPLLEIGGRPLLDHVLDHVLDLQELEDITLVTNHRFAAHFERWADALDSPVPLRVIDDGTTSNDDRLGAIGDLALVLQRLATSPDDRWLVAAGDNLIEIDLAAVQRDFMATNATRIIVRPLGPAPGPSRYNDVALDEDGRVTRFREKPEQSQGRFAAVAVYFFPGDLERWVAEYLAEGGNPDAPGYFMEWLCAREPVFASQLAGRWFDIGNHETLAAARRAFETT